MYVVTLIEIGDDVGFIIPDEILARYNLKIGDGVEVLETDKGLTLIPPSIASVVDRNGL
ncbi:AbrB/MazE/SpoVT family DNA-binding domain-containing protein [Phyllobacterium myrsinacearum]|uniref:Bifunctional DNA-binding transcriptional regulator/antitoxin component of YhaV-PrlF toxin-antitoxin module n=1 Tax=Phyllobacterium myrsinacearum TaxID=28101 RepID=A0A839EJU8_9HYPH|nr:AbrB/MazE/SpoVT family DNA-binding domain-containing protein [Phyllobacterium myrsinacearum]MBA8876777.1 bifunctional DNA-binding transcriptional regulator/antitoxin component of YhaV-PrlF toxin-antitoxin module [Phyllobacterium myrsinacearum]